MTFAQRQLSISFSLDSGTFDGNNNTATLSGYRAHALIEHAGGPSDGTLDLTIYGMKQSMMDQLSTLGMQINLVPKNTIVVTAGDKGAGGGSTVFLGYILAAYADFKGQPEVAFHVTAHTGLPQAVAPAQASSYRGSTDVATIMQSLATMMGLRFENSGVQGKLVNPYFSGSAKSQMRKCADAAGINATIIDGTLAIWPRGGFRNGQIPLVSPDTGLKGYPSYTAYGIMLETLYNPSIGFGQKIQVHSSLKPANGEWAVYSLSHDLAAETPGGNWHSTILAYNPKFPTPVK
jgi:hypothetical protein